MKEITFIVNEDEVDGGFVAQAYWPQGNRNIVTEADTHDELLRNIREAVEASFDDSEARPGLIHLHFVRDEVIVR